MQATDKHGRFDTDTQEYLSDLFANTRQTLNELQEEADFYELHDEDVLEAILLQEATIEKLLGQLRDEEDEVARWLTMWLKDTKGVTYHQVAQAMVELDDGPHTETEIVEAFDAADVPRSETRHILLHTRERYALEGDEVDL